MIIEIFYCFVPIESSSTSIFIIYAQFVIISSGCIVNYPPSRTFTDFLLPPLRTLALSLYPY